MSTDYSTMTIAELEKEIEAILKKQRNQDDLFRLAVLVGQLDLAKFIYHDEKRQPDNRYLKTGFTTGEPSAFAQALAQLLLLMKSRGMDFREVFRIAVEHMKDDEYKAREPAKEGVKGIPVGGGKARGKAYVVSETSPLGKAPPGRILILEHATAEMTMSMAHVAAVVSDQGGRLCHLATVARERGFPAVVGTGNATSLIKTGDNILVDADEGIVSRI
jgi:phosphohistidine swiveling domain-containing protein